LVEGAFCGVKTLTVASIVVNDLRCKTSCYVLALAGISGIVHDHIVGTLTATAVIVGILWVGAVKIVTVLTTASIVIESLIWRAGRIGRIGRTLTAASIIVESLIWRAGPIRIERTLTAARIIVVDLAWRTCLVRYVPTHIIS
jgi:hypothetical protein